MARSDRIATALAVATAAFVSAPGALQAQGTIPGTVVRRRVPGARDPGLRDPGPREPRFNISIKGQAGRVNLPRRGGVLGLENNNVRPEIRFVFEPDDEADMSGAEARIDFDLTGIVPAVGPDALFGPGPVRKRTWAGFGMSFSRFDVNAFQPELNPQGDALLLPGPEGGPSGFRLTDRFNQGANIARDLRFESEYDLTTGFAEFGQRCYYPGGFGIGGFLGSSFGRLELDERFSGQVPGFFADFRYDSDIQVDNWRTYVGLDAEKWLTPNVALFGRGDVGLNVLDANGHDRLDFNFFAGSNRSINLLSEDGTDWSARASGGLKLRANLIEASIGGFWEREAGVPVLNRLGQDPSFVSLETSDTFGGFGRVSLGFNRPPPAAPIGGAVLPY